MNQPKPIRDLTSELEPRKGFRETRNRFFSKVSLIAAGVALFILISLLAAILLQGSSSLGLDFIKNAHIENRPEISGISQALVGSVVLCLIAALVALPVGVGAAIYLEEFKPRNRWMQKFQNLVQLNINNLAGIPSIVYGVLGVTLFVYMFGLFEPIQVNKVPAVEVGAKYFYQGKTVSNRRAKIQGNMFRFPCTDSHKALIEINEPIEVIDSSSGEKYVLNVIGEEDPLPDDKALLARTVRRGTSASRFAEYTKGYFHLPLGKSILSAGLTLALVILPIIIITSQEALRAVPGSMREACMGLGATRWQAVSGVVLPQALPGILTGTILSVSRAMGEAAPIIAVMGGILGTTNGLTNLMDASPALSVTIYKWSSHQNNDYEMRAAGAIIVLLLILLVMNSLAVVLRYRLEKKQTI